MAWRVDDLVEPFGVAAAALDRSDLVAAVQALVASRPAEGVTVICHGDLHPFNLLVDIDHVTVVDWTGSIRAEPAFDVAFTELLLANPPLGASGLLGAVVARVGAALGRRFVARYRAVAPGTELESLGWYRALHGIRVLVEVASLEARQGTGAGRHPFAMLIPAATSAVRAVTEARSDS